MLFGQSFADNLRSFCGVVCFSAVFGCYSGGIVAVFGCDIGDRLVAFDLIGWYSDCILHDSLKVCWR